MWAITLRTLLELGAIRMTLARQHRLLLIMVILTSMLLLVIVFKLERDARVKNENRLITTIGKSGVLTHHLRTSWLLAEDDEWNRRCQPLVDHLKDPQFVNNDKGNLRRKRPLVFLKTHKTGSSTVQNILLRYGASNQLTFAMPTSDNYFYCQQEVPVDLKPCWTKGKKAEIFCLHTDCYTKEDFQRHMVENPFWLTILRQPDAVFESIYRYYMLFDSSKVGMTYQDFLVSKPSKLPKQLVFPDRPIYVGANQMIRDLGLPTNKMNEAEAVKSHLQYLNATYDFVMIAEHMEESLILLRHKVGFGLEDILALDVNKRIEGEHHLRQNLSTEQKERLIQVNKADHMLYKFFFEKFLQELHEFGQERMKTELEAYRCLKKAMKNKCRMLALKGDFLPIMFKPGYHSSDIRGYYPALSPTTPPVLNWHCNRLAFSELPHVDVVRLEQRINVALKCNSTVIFD